MTIEPKPVCPRCQSPMQSVAKDSHVCPRCELAGALGVPEPTGGPAAETLGNYVIESLIAHGGMGAVYRAYDRATGKSVAIKTLLAGRLAGEESRQRFFREARVASQLQHRHIVPTLDVGESEGVPYLVMEEMAGKNLADLVRDGPLLPVKAAVLVFKVAGALAHAHAQGVLHRDLKPANILLDADGEPLVTDFGLARLMDGQTTELTMSGQVLGSPGYLPPERVPHADDSLKPKNEDHGVASDVYSLGATLYHLLTGRPPFQAATIEAVLMQVANSEPISLRKLSPSVPPALEAVCLKCLEKDPHRRYANMREFADDLERFTNNHPVRARLPGTLARSWKWCRRNRALTASGAAVLLLLLTVAIGSPIAAVRINRERRAAATEAAKSQQVAAFLQSMLEGAKPEVARGRDTTLLREILDQTAKRLETEFQDQPEVEAQLRLVLGEVYEVLDRFESAAKHLRKSWEMRRKLFGDEHPETLAAKLALAKALESDDRPNEAKALTQEVVASYRRQFGAQDLRTIKALHVLGNVLKRTGELPESIATLREVVKLKLAVHGAESPSVVSAFIALGVAHVAARQYDESAACFQECLHLGRKLGLTNDYKQAEAMGWLGYARVRQGRFAEADSLLQTSLDIKRSLLAEDHGEIARHLFLMIESLAAQGRIPAAGRLLDQAWTLAARNPSESLDLSHDLARQGKSIYAAWATTNAEAVRLSVEWQRRVQELESSHPELRDKK